jgi:Phosphotransferase enzyme family
LPGGALPNQVSQPPNADDMSAAPAAEPAEKFQIPAAQRQGHAMEIARGGLEIHYKSPVESVDILKIHQRINSRVLDCVIHLANGQQHRVMIKIYEPIGAGTKASLEKLISDDFSITTRLHHHFQSNPRFQVPTPLFHSPQDMVIVTEHMPGMQLQEKLVAQAGWFPGQATTRDLELNCKSCGEWLRAFQAATLDSISGGLDLERMRDMIAMRLQWLVDNPNMPIDGKKRDLILAHFDREIKALQPEDLAVSSIHGDFFPGNVLVEGNRVVGLDFAMCRIGSTCADPSYFMFQLETLTYKPKFRRGLIRKLQRAFLQGYNPSIPAKNYFTSSPIVRIHFILHNVMRLAGMTSSKANISWKRKLHNWGVAIAVTKRLLRIARAH